MKNLLYTVGFVAAIFAAAVLIDQFSALKQLTAYLNDHPEPYRALAFGLAILGLLLLLVAFLLGIIDGRRMTEAEAQHFMQPRHGRFRGAATGQKFRGEATFRELKDAFRSGEWRRDRTWGPMVIGLIAVPLVLYGMFGFFFVIGAPAVKLLCVGVVLYATARTLWAFWKA